MRLRTFLILASSLPAFAACNAMTPSQIASVSCFEVQAGAEIAATIANDAITGASAATPGARAQQTANALRKTVADVCPTIVTASEALDAGAGSRSGK